MSIVKQNNFLVFLFLAAIAVILSISGCKEGTEKSPVSSLLTGSDMTQTPSLPEVSDPTKSYELSGLVTSKASLEPLTNIRVDLYFNGQLAATTRTTSEGKFFYSGLPAGLYDLTAAPADDNYETETYVVRILTEGDLSPAAPEIQLTNKSTPASGELKVKISGLVKDKQDSSPVNNIAIEIYKNDVLQKTVYSSGEGKFFFEDLTEGLYRIEAGKESPLYMPQNANLTILSDGTVSPPTPTIYLTKRPEEEDFTIVGTVTTRSSEKLANIKVDLRKDSSTADVVSSTYTTGEGKFFFQNLTSGMFYLTANVGKNTLQSEIYPVRILSNGTISPEEAEIFVPQNATSETVNVVGKIYDAFTGGPLEYATVILSGYTNNLTDKDGEFSFTELLPGTYKLEISKQGFEKLEASFQVNEGGSPVTTPSTLAYPLIHTERTGYGSIAGRLVDINTEEGIPGKLVTLYNYHLVTKGNESDWELAGRTLTTRTLADNPETPQDEKGTFKLTHLAPTSDTNRYAIQIGDNEPSTVYQPRIDSDFTWKVFVTPANAFSVYGFTVISAQTTFWTNYEHIK